MIRITAVLVIVGFLAANMPTVAAAAPYSIPTEKVEAKKVYFGISSKFEKPGEVDYERILKATPEYKQVVSEKVESGTGKYWILISQASDRVTKAISEVGEKTDVDFIAARGYLASLEPAIPAEDITKVVIEKVEGSSKQAKKMAKVAKAEKPVSAKKKK